MRRLHLRRTHRLFSLTPDFSLQILALVDQGRPPLVSPSETDLDRSFIQTDHRPEIDRYDQTRPSQGKLVYADDGTLNHFIFVPAE